MNSNLDAMERAVLALTNEIPNYAEQIATDLHAPVTELWGIVLAATDRMTYVDGGADSNGTEMLGVVDALLPEGTTRFALWKRALRLIVVILGDPESHYRTGFNSKELGLAIDAVFGAG